MAAALKKRIVPIKLQNTTLQSLGLSASNRFAIPIFPGEIKTS